MSREAAAAVNPRTYLRRIRRDRLAVRRLSYQNPFWMELDPATLASYLNTAMVAVNTAATAVNTAVAFAGGVVGLVQLLSRPAPPPENAQYVVHEAQRLAYEAGYRSATQQLQDGVYPSRHLAQDARAEHRERTRYEIQDRWTAVEAALLSDIDDEDAARAVAAITQQFRVMRSANSALLVASNLDLTASLD